MEVILIVIALLVAFLALCIAIKNGRAKEIVTHEKTVEIVKPTVETPFTIDSNGDFTLDGNLRVTGCVSLFKKGGK